MKVQSGAASLLAVADKSDVTNANFQCGRVSSSYELEWAVGNVASVILLPLPVSNTNESV